MNTNDKMSPIDAAIAAAKQRKAQRTADEGSTASGQAVEKAIKKTDVTPEEKALQEQQKAAAKAKKAAERAAKKLEKESERNSKRAARDEKRAAKKLVREAERASRKPHTSKLDKARTKLTELSDAAFSAYQSTVSQLSSAELIALAQHLEFEARSRQTVAALGASLKAGQVVRITGGKDTRTIGKLGTLTKVQRIRCYVAVPGIKRPVYLFTSDVTAASLEEAETLEQNDAPASAGEAAA